MVRVKTVILLAIGGLVVAAGFVVFGIVQHKESYAYQQLLLTSNRFASGQELPKDNTCEGANISPELLLQDIPGGAHSVVVDLVDTSNEDSAQWLMWNISPEVTEIPQGASAAVGEIGVNNSGKQIYAGPCAKNGTHHYHFEAYALDTILNLPTGSGYSEVQQAMKKHILAYGSLTAVYTTGKSK